jgi:ribosomal protein L37AE/L43A
MADATTKQKQYLRRLGHKEVSGLTKTQASALIDSLLEAERESGKQFACPYCKGKFGPRPKTRTKKCPHCGKTIYHVVGKFYTEEGMDVLDQAEWYKEQRALVKETVREDWKLEREHRQKFKEEITAGYIVKVGPNCPHAAKLDGLLVLIEDATKHPDMLPPYEECRHNTCECEFEDALAHDVPRGTRVAQLASDPATGGRGRQTPKGGCAPVLFLMGLLLLSALAVM